MARSRTEHQGRCASKREAVVSLPVLRSEHVGGHPTRIKRSRASWWRFVALVLVNAAIATHIAVWAIFSMRDGLSETLSPVEPSESMYTLETGVLNAGFIFFAVAILLTLIFGRFVCGWGCHVIALQDLCSWAMTKLRVKPRPFRSRLLLYVPLVVALYMFVWPTFKRLVLKPAFGENWRHVAVWLGEAPTWPGWSNGLFVEDFWRTFPPWYVAIPFLLVCGFAMVYFLGSKAFCSYACPYGGFFGPADRLAVGKIRVTDDCEQCGHCTAVCTSNVRVHEEVRDFGMVVNPGCMKCMDCISVCPNDALYFGFGKPAVLAKPKDTAARVRREGMSGNFDLSWPEEIAVAGLFLLLFLAFRGFLNQVPLLMALAMAGIGAFAAWKLWRLALDPSVRVQSLQLKLKGRFTNVGRVFAVLAALYLGVAAWSGLVRWTTWRAGLAADQVTVPREQAFTPGFKADAANLAFASKALARYRLADSDHNTGFGWPLRPGTLAQMAYLSLVCSRPDEAEAYLRRAIDSGGPTDELVTALGELVSRKEMAAGREPKEVVALYQGMLARKPDLHVVRSILAAHALEQGRGADAVKLSEEAIAAMPKDPVVRMNAAGVFLAVNQEARGLSALDEAANLAMSRPHVVGGHAETLRQLAGRYLQLGKTDRALPLIEEAARRSPGLPAVFADLGVAYLSAGKLDRAIDATRQAVDRLPESPDLAARLADLYGRANQPAERERWEARAQELRARAGSPPAAAPPPVQ